MAGKKKSGIEGVAIVIGVGLLLLASIPKEVWIGIGVFAAAVVVVYLYRKYQEANPAIGVVHADEILQPFVPPEPQSQESQFAPVSQPKPAPRWDDAPTFVAPKSAPSPSYSVPALPKEYGQASWIPRGQSITIVGLIIPGGMLYFGTTLKTSYNDNDPCLIDPSRPVADEGNFTERQTDYWPSYSKISDSARRAYLNWLADGKKDPEADIGYVFLYFYGLERRAVIDLAKDTDARVELPEIVRELKRLVDIYGAKSSSFRRYANELIGWVELASHPSRLYDREVPDFPRTWEVPVFIRLALGQASVAGVPVPAHLALAWVRLDPNTKLRTPAKRCVKEFAKLFELKYADTFGAGIILPINKTKLKLVYRAASPAFHGFDNIQLNFGETPDVTVLTAPVNRLRLLVDAATKELEGFSRYLGRTPGANSSLEGLLQLPATLWPESAQKVLQALKARMGAGMVTLTFEELLSTLEAKTALTKDKVLGLARALESMDIAMEPDVLGGAQSPKSDAQVVLFSIQPGEPLIRNSPAYQAALLTLQLASAVASADGEFCVQELTHLRKQVESWTHLTPSHHRRLMAHLRLLMTTPVSLASLKKRLEPLAMPAKETIAAFMVTVAQADGVVSPAEVEMLENVHKALGVDSKKVFGDLHAAAAGTPSDTPVTSEVESGFKLDLARIAALQQDSEKVSALLAGIFKEEEPPVVAIPEPVVAEQSDEPSAVEGLLGLDDAHSSFVRMLLSRPQWSRVELLDVAQDLELMLDGALEHINEASFDKYDTALTEGDDPIEVRAEVLEKIEA